MAEVGDGRLDQETRKSFVPFLIRDLPAAATMPRYDVPCPSPQARPTTSRLKISTLAAPTHLPASLVGWPKRVLAETPAAGAPKCAMKCAQGGRTVIPSSFPPPPRSPPLP